MACVGIIAKDFEVMHYEIEKKLNKIENGGGQDNRLIDLLGHYRERQNFYEELEQKVKCAIDNNQI